MKLRLLLLVLPALLLAGCAGQVVPDPEKGEACASELGATKQELEDARSRGLASRIPWIKAANLVASAEIRMQAEKYDSCLEKVRRARLFIRAAEQ